MSFQIQSKQINAGDSQEFTFPSAIGMYVYGISGFELSAGNNPSKLNTASISLSASTSSDYKTVTIGATLSIIDDSTATNWVQVTVLAWLGSDAPAGIYLVNRTGIGPGMPPDPFGIDNPPIVGAAMLSGFDLSFSNGSSTLIATGAAAGCTSSPFSSTLQALPIGEGLLIGTGNNPSSNTIDAGLVILTEAQENVQAGMYFDGSQTYSETESTFGTNSYSVSTLGMVPTQVAMFLQSFYLQYTISSEYDPTPQVTYIEVGASDVTTTETGFTFTSTRMQYDSYYYDGELGYDVAIAATSLAATYFYIALAAPSASAISPTSGDTAGGTQVTLTGENFSDGAVVYFGNTEATNVQVTSTTELSATVPPAVSAGTVDVYVATNAGVSQSLSFDYELGVPSVTAVTPNYGSMSGGTVVSIEGSGLASNGDLAITEVMFGSVAATGLSYDAATQTLAATSPAATAAELVDIVVSNAAGSSAKNYNDQFSYSTTSDIVAERVEKEDKKS
jgi:hypothetical protein